MLLDTYLTYEQKIYIAIICSAFWIYFRTVGSYASLPRKSIISVILVSIWMYCNYYEPLSTPIGLSIMILYSFLFSNKNSEL